MKRTIYEAPRTVLYKVEVEGVICGSADVENKPENKVGISDHEVSGDFDFSKDQAWE